MVEHYKSELTQYVALHNDYIKAKVNEELARTKRPKVDKPKEDL